MGKVIIDNDSQGMITIGGLAAIVLGVMGADVHAIGNRILAYAFEQAGFKVVNIGVLAAQEEFINAAVETGAKAILVSSLYGHGEIDCPGLREKAVEAGIGRITMYVGGNLVVGKREWKEVEAIYIRMGFDRVYPAGTLPEEAIMQLKQDLQLVPV